MPIQVKLQIVNYDEARAKIVKLKKKSKEVIKALRELRNEANELCREYNKINKVLKVRINQPKEKGNHHGKRKSKKGK